MKYQLRPPFQITTSLCSQPMSKWRDHVTQPDMKMYENSLDPASLEQTNIHNMPSNRGNPENAAFFVALMIMPRKKSTRMSKSVT